MRVMGSLEACCGMRSMMMFIPRGWNLFFSGTGTADFHPDVLEKIAEKKLRVRDQSRDY